MSEGKGEFFAVGKSQWAKACELGLNPAVAFLVMARGSGRDNSTTMWSAEATFKHTGLAWRRAHNAIAALIEAGLATVEQGGKRPRYKLAKPAGLEDMIWLPNAFVTGAASETPPLARLRQTQEPDYLQALVELYGEHDLADDGGLPRRLVRTPYDVRERICGWGPFDVVGFDSSDNSSHCYATGPMARFHEKVKPKDGWRTWRFLGAMEEMGLLERAVYLAESTDPDAELVHALTGDAYAEAVRDAAMDLAESLPGGFKYEAESHSYVLPIPKHMGKATVVGIMRLRYRPRTRKTSAWYGRHVETCQQFEAQYRQLAAGQFKAEAA